MDLGVIWDERDLIVNGFVGTLKLLALSGAIALALGSVLAACRVSPIMVLRGVGTSYVNVFRNVPLVVLFILVVYGLPEIGITSSFFIRAVIALSIYTAAFVCEALRSGVNAVPLGQAEAARSIGMGFGASLSHVVFPQAIRAAVTPVANVLIALTKNTSVAYGFGVIEATFRLKGLINSYASQYVLVFVTVALGYVLIVFVISSVAHYLERRWAVAR